MDNLTPRGRKLMKWLKHWAVASKVADGSAEAAPGGLTDEAKAAEKDALRIIRNMVKAKYRTREARRIAARWRA
jgi:hypothetical protein